MKSNHLRDATRGLIILAVVLIVSVSAAAQSSSAASLPPTPQTASTPRAPQTAPTLEREFFKNILRDQRAIWTSPFRWRGRDARWLAPLGVSTAALIATDRRTAGEIGEFDDQFTVSRNVSRMAAFYTTGGIVTTFYLIGRVKHDARARETGLLGAEALINGLIVSESLKAITQRPRPFGDKGRGRFFSGGNSFPSGHAIAAWSLATVVANEYRHRRVVQFGVYGLAAAASVSRYTGQKHFLSDVLVGSAIGYGIGRYVYRTHHSNDLDSLDASSASSHSKLFPLVTPSYRGRARGYGITLAWKF